MMPDERSSNAAAPLPPVELRIAVAAVAFLMGAAALHQGYVAVAGEPFNAAVAVILIAGAVGLVRKVRWGRRVAVLFLWVAILAAFGSLSPFMAGDLMAQGVEPPSVPALVLRLAGVCAVALAGLHYLGKHKVRFRAAWL
jgi:hypothetical protein